MGCIIISEIPVCIFKILNIKTYCLLLLLILIFSPSNNSAKSRVSKASCNVTYISPVTGQPESEMINGSYGTGLHDDESGRLISIRTVDNTDDGCSDYNMNIPTFKWVALIRRGGCKFHDKIERAQGNNASAVVIYNAQNRSDSYYMIHKVEGIVAVSIPHADGVRLVTLLNQGTNVNISITERKRSSNLKLRASKGGGTQFLTSMVLSLLSAFCLLVISLGWCVFFIVQRCQR